MPEWWETADASWSAPAAATENDDSKKWEAKDSAWDTSSWDAAGAEKSAWDQAGGTAQEAAAPAADGWGDQKDPWGAGASSTPPATDFWETQKWNKENGVLSKKEDWELEKDEIELFNLQGRAQAGIDFEKYEQVPVNVSGSKADKIPVCKTFEEIYQKGKWLIPEALEANLRKVQYRTPTPVQKFAVPCGLVGRDIMCCAQTGSGKTAAFLIPVIGRMMNHHTNPVGAMETPFEGACAPDTLVMTPTRELCIQIYEEALKFCHRTPYRVFRVYGGEKPKVQLVEIAKGADLIVATPGRLQDFINRQVMKVSSVHVLVLDEADRMLDMGFESQIREIVESHEMPDRENRQTMMFSATFPESCQKMASDYLYDHVWIAVGIVGSAVETVQQLLKKVTPASKFEELISTMDEFFATRENKARMLVFVNAKDTAKWLDEQLYDKKFETGALHGNLGQEERETNLARFRRGDIEIMVATDVAARGLDIENVGWVVNYDMPRDTDTYIHRIGRTGRIGNKGKAVTFLTCDEGEVCLESVQLLKELSTVMENSQAALPDWLNPLIASAESGSWSWGGKDAREGQEVTTWTGGGDAWWEKSGDAAATGADDSAWKDTSEAVKDAWQASDWKCQ